MTLATHWPLFELTITTPNLTLRVPDDSMLVELAELAARGVHEPETMPFLVPWTDADPSVLPQQFLQYHWDSRAAFSPSKWDLNFVVIRNGEVLGSQALHTLNYAEMRTAESGSWLGLAHQGQGVGKEMRAAVLAFAFEYLHAERITSGAFVDNVASNRVSEACGYERNGTAWVLRRGVPGQQHKYLLTRARWESHGVHLPITVSGLEPCLPLLGLGMRA